MSDTHSDSLSRRNFLPAWLKSVFEFFSPNRRIGRLRFLLYMTLWPISSIAILFSIDFVILSWYAYDLNQHLLNGWLGFFMFVPVIPFFSIILIQRLHDIGLSGWFSLIMLAALVFPYLLALTAILLLIPGSSHENHYGPAPPPNGLGVKLGFGALFPLFVLAVILAPYLTDKVA